jgi:Spy/CpxP family protein refolding chaperone
MRTPERIWLWLLVLAAMGGPVYAQVGLADLPPGKWWINRRVIQQLELTREQQQKIESIWMEDRKELIDLKAELDKSQLDLAELIRREVVDEAAALAAFDRVQGARMTLERKTFLMRIRIKNVLTAQQQRRLEELSEMLRRNRNVPPAGARPGAGRNQPPAGAPPPPEPF